MNSSGSPRGSGDEAPAAAARAEGSLFGGAGPAGLPAGLASHLISLARGTAERIAQSPTVAEGEGSCDPAFAERAFIDFR